MFDFSGPSAASARCTSARARCHRGSAAAAGPDAAEVAQRRLDRRLRGVDRVDQLATRRRRSARRSPAPARRSRRRARARPCWPAARQRSRRLAPALVCATPSASRWVWGTASLVPSRDLARSRRPPARGRRSARRRRPRPARARGSGARSRPAAARGRSRAGPAGGPPDAICRVRLRSTAVRSSSDAGPRTASMPGRRAASFWNRFSRRRRCLRGDRPLGLEVDLERRRPARAAVALEGLEALARRVVGRQVLDVRRSGVEGQRGRGEQQQRERRQQHRRPGACATRARTGAPTGSRRGLDHSCQRLTLVPSTARPAGIANSAVDDGEHAGDDHAQRRRLEQRSRRDEERAQHAHRQRGAREHDRPAGAHHGLLDGAPPRRARRPAPP